jgi:cell division protein ZapA
LETKRQNQEHQDHAEQQRAASDSEADSQRPERRSVSIKLGGKQYRLRSDADEDWLQQVASYVDSSMEKVRARTDLVDSLDIALLAALNLAREVLQMRRAKADGPGDAIDPERLRDLIELVETELSETAAPASPSAP